METYDLNLGLINGTISILINRKDIKNVHLRVCNDLTVKLSVPKQATDEYINEFLSKRIDWINDNIFKYKQSSGTNTMEQIKNGTSIKFLGKDKRVRIYFGVKDINIQDNIINITIDNNNPKILYNLFEKWWINQLEIILFNEIEIIYSNIFKKYSLDKPIFSIRKMTTMWGNCNYKNKTLSFNSYLLKAPLQCIQYVVLHEMSHLMYPNHNESFYNFLTIHMPDWKQRKKVLDTEVVQGLS